VPVSVDQHETCWLIRAEGEVTVSCAADLKKLLLEGLTSGKEMHIDLTKAEEIDITLLQLLRAVGHDTERQSGALVSGVSEAAVAAAKGAGFESFPGTSESGENRG